jgi:hypothetical protein
MGTVMSLVFIAVAAAAGVLVGTRPTVMDGRWMAAKLVGADGDGDTSGGDGDGKDGGDGGAGRFKLECQREIPIGVQGAKFACTAPTGERLRYRMGRDGKVVQIGGEPDED